MSKSSDNSKKAAPAPAPRRLGVVSRLISDKASALEGATSKNNEALIVPIERLQRNPNQPRKVFDEERDLELAENIRENGILEPLIVREIEEGQYEIVAGERRYRAARLAGKQSVPVIVKEYDDRQAQLVAVIENLQRLDLDAKDEAFYFKFLVDNYNYSYRDIARMVHRSYSYVNDRMRLIELADDTTSSGEKGNKRQGNDQKLQTSQSGRTRLPKREVRYTPKTLFSFDSWLDKTHASLQQLKPDEKSELRTKLAELRSKIEALENDLPKN